MAGNASASLAAMFAARVAANKMQLKYFAAGICGLMGIFIVFHWVRWIFVRSSIPRGVKRPFTLITRLTRNILVRKVPGFPSAGHALLVAVYVAINAAVSFTNLDKSSGANFAARFGWLATANMVLLVFLALKNTPLAFLSAYSYERLNCVHQVAGYTMFVFMLLHAAMYTSFFNNSGRMQSQFEEIDNEMGILAGFAFFTVVFAGMIIRSYWYELFYILHIMFWVVGVIATGLHQPAIGKPILVMTLLAASMWFVDRVLRSARMLWYSANNEAKLYPLPEGGTKIVMKKTPAFAQAGKHCFVWIPAIRSVETHPFTIVSTKPLEFTVRARDGFTKDLYDYAVSHPGVSLRASVDGPYGTFPDPMSYDKVVLIAGGGGATFTFGLAVNILERMNERTEKNLVFVWAVKKHDNLSWFKEHLNTLRTHTHSSKVDISLYVTRSPPEHQVLHHHLHNHTRSSSDSSDGPSPIVSPVATDVEKAGQLQQPPATLQPRVVTISSGDIEKKMEDFQERHIIYEAPAAATTAQPPKDKAVNHHPSIPELHQNVKAGRPDVAQLIRGAVANTPKHHRVLVVACGPAGLMRVVRDTTASLMKGDGPGVELHCEQFGW